MSMRKITQSLISVPGIARVAKKEKNNDEFYNKKFSRTALKVDIKIVKLGSR